MPSTKTILVGVTAALCLTGADAMAFARGGRAAKKAPAKKTIAKRAPVAKRAPPPKKAKAPSKKAATKTVSGPEGDIGVTPPLGLFDPLGFLNRGPDAYRRYQEIEIKHGRIAMAATLGVIVTEAGLRLPGSLSLSQGLDYATQPGDLAGAYFGTPLAGWVQIAAFIAALDVAVFVQDPDAAPGDTAKDLPIEWVRYDDPEVKTFKLNIERQNGRAAMMGITGCLVHELLGVDALFPIGGEAGPQPIIDSTNSFGGFPAWIMA